MFGLVSYEDIKNINRKLHQLETYLNIELKTTPEETFYVKKK
jgi:hypothetical protein